MRASSANDARKLENPAAAHAGIIDVDSFKTRDLAALEPLLRHKQIGWIALVDPARLAEPEVRKLIHQCCFDYVKRPLTRTMIGYLVSHAYGMVSLGESEPAAEAGAANGVGYAMVGTCEPMQQLFRTIRKVANTDASVFVSGESGTGKELTAIAIHKQSSRRKAPFIAINCGAIPHHLLQSELFGYERGAFTGANKQRVGRVEAAHGGTLFLDEIGDMPLESQASLLRFLQEGRIERLGGHESIPVDVRVVSATHVDLEAAIRNGQFREDLFHRLCVLHIEEPPLRARGRDIELLANHVLQKFHSDGARKIRGFTACAISAMYGYPWPGNVRELIKPHPPRDRDGGKPADLGCRSRPRPVLGAAASHHVGRGARTRREEPDRGGAAAPSAPAPGGGHRTRRVARHPVSADEQLRAVTRRRPPGRKARRPRARKPGLANAHTSRP